MPFSILNTTLEIIFYKPDLQAIRVVLGTAKTHYLDIGDPAWIFLVGPPGTGKTVTSIMSAAGLDQVVELGGFTENTFISGFYEHKQPGLLEKLGDPVEQGNVTVTEGDCLLLIKDFTTVLSMRREKRAEMLSQFREIYDGRYKRDFGTGDSKQWRGKVTVIAAVTPELDRHYSIFSTLGERFLQVRIHRPDSPQAGERAIGQQGSEKVFREALQEEVKDLFAQSLTTLPVLQEEDVRRIAALAEFVALARTHVPRSNYGSREIEYVPEPEANTRLSKQFAGLGRGIAALNRHATVQQSEIHDLFRVALDCIPETRRRLLVAVIQGNDPSSVKLPRTVRCRALEDLKELGILTQDDTLTEQAAPLLKTAGLSQETCPNLFGGGQS